MVLFIVVADDIPIGERLYFIGLTVVWILLAFIAVLTTKNATKIGIKFMEKKTK